METIKKNANNLKRIACVFTNLVPKESLVYFFLRKLGLGVYPNFYNTFNGPPLSFDNFRSRIRFVAAVAAVTELSETRDLHNFRGNPKGH